MLRYNARRFFHFLTSYYKYFLAGRPKATLQLRVARMQVCLHCKHFDYKLEACWLCGCPVDKKTKLLTEKCPDNPPRWH